MSLDETLRQRHCCYCNARITADTDYKDDDTFQAFECKNGHQVYVPWLCRESQIVRLYIDRGDVLAQDVLIGGDWKRMSEYDQAFSRGFTSVYDELLCSGYRAVLNQGFSNPYRYFRKERDEEAVIELRRVHWEECRAIGAMIPEEI